MFFQLVHRGENHFWQYLVTVIAVILAYGIGQLPLILVVLQATASSGEAGSLEEFSKNLDFVPLGIELNFGLLLILLTFVIAMLVFWLMIKMVHKRSLLSLITAQSTLNWRKVFFGFGLWMFFTVVLEVANFLMAPDMYHWHFDIKSFIPLVLIAILILPVQTSFEEIFFRGYLMQGFGLLSKNRWVPLLITSVLFGAMHGLNPEVEEFGMGWMMSYYISFGLFLAILTLMDDSLELALGIHAATNIFGATIVTFEGSALQTQALFTSSEVNIGLILPVFIVLAGLFIFICSSVYKWKDWRKIYGSIVLPDRTEI